jgi:hypothetical protein
MAFATTTDVGNRLGRTLTTDETGQATALLDLIALEIEDACGKDASTVSPEPPILKLVSIEATVRAIANPVGIKTESETLGAHSYSATFPTTDGLLLTSTERSLVRKAVLGGYLLSPRTPPIEDTFYPPEIDTFFIGS